MEVKNGISVLMSIYSEPIEWIVASINSILTQSFEDFEFIIVDDNPQRKENIDVLVNVQKRDSRIKIIQNDKNIGLTKSLNRALLVADGKYIARMDADDISLPERFQRQYDFMEKHPSVGVCGCNVRTFGKKNVVWSYPATHQQCLLFFKSPFAHPAVLIRKDVLQEYDLKYDEKLRYAQDFDLWERLYSITLFSNLQEVLFLYRISDSQITSQKQIEQYKISTSIKLRAFNTYCSCNNVNFKITNPILLTTIKEYKKNVIIPGFNHYLFLPYLYRSLQRDYLKALLHYFIKGDFLHLSCLDSVKILLHILGLRKRLPLLSFTE